MSGVRGRPGSRRFAVAVAAVLCAASVAACGSRRQFETATVAPPVPAVAPVPPRTPQPPAPPPLPPVLVGEVEPDAAPAVPSGPVEIPDGIGVMGRLVIPQIGLDATVVEGEALSVLRFGPGHRAGTALPGQLGNVVVAGHRTTHTRPFRHLDLLQPGDPLIFETATGVYHYVFEAHQVVGPSQVGITQQPNGYIATLYACHPPGSARTRLVAYFRLVSAPEVGQPDPSTVEHVPLPLV